MFHGQDSEASASDSELLSTRSTWDTAVASDWKWVGPPARPSVSELSVIDSVLRRYPRHSRMLILGSTAEFRDLAYEHKFDTTIMDYNPRNYEILRRYMRHPSGEPEQTLVEKDWREIDYESRFDIVLGDLALNMVPLSEQQELIGKLTGALTPNGYSVQRVWVRDSAKYSPQHTTLEDIICEHRETRAREGYDYFYSLALPLISFFHSEDRGETQFQHILHQLRIKHEKGEIDDEFMRAFDRPWGRYTMPNRLPSYAELDGWFRQKSNVVDVKHGDDLFSNYCPIYVTQRKSVDDASVI